MTTVCLEAVGMEVEAPGTGLDELVGDTTSVTEGSDPVTGFSGSCLKPFTTSSSPPFLLEEKAMDLDT